MAEITPIQMHAAPTSSQDTAVNIDIPADGVLVGLDWSARASGMDGDGNIFEAELSFNSTNQRLTNDARAGISALKIGVTAATVAAIAMTGANKSVDLRDGIAVNAGERLYMHYQTSAGVSGAIILMLYFRFRTARRAATRRR